MRRFTRRERRRLDEAAAQTTAEALAHVELVAAETSTGRPTPADIELWFSNSVGTWKRGFRAAE